MVSFSKFTANRKTDSAARTIYLSVLIDLYRNQLTPLMLH